MKVLLTISNKTRITDDLEGAARAHFVEHGLTDATLRAFAEINRDAGIHVRETRTGFHKGSTVAKIALVLEERKGGKRRRANQRRHARTRVINKLRPSH